MSYLRFADAFPNPQPKKDKDDPLAFLDPPKPNVPAPQSGHIRFSDAFPNPVKEEKSDPLAFLNQQTPTQPDKPKGPNLWQKMWQGIGTVRKKASEDFGARTDVNPIAGFVPGNVGTDTLLGAGIRLAALGAQKAAAPIVGEQRAKESTADLLSSLKHASQSFADFGTLGMIPKRDEAQTVAEKAGSGVGAAAAMLIPVSGAYSAGDKAVRVVGRVAPRLVGGPVTQEILKGAIAGSLAAGGDTLIRTEGDLGEAGKAAAVGAGLGGTLGGVAGGISRAAATAPARRLARNVEGQIVRQPTSRTFRVVSHEQRLDDVLQQIQPKVEQRVREINAARMPPLERKSNLVKYVRDEMPGISRKEIERLSYDDLVELATEIGQRKPAPNVQQIAREEAQKLGHNLDELLDRASRERPFRELLPSPERSQMARAAGVLPNTVHQSLYGDEFIRNIGRLRKGSRLLLKDGTEAIVSGFRRGNVQVGIFERNPDGKLRHLRNVEVSPKQLGATIPRKAARAAARMLPETQARLAAQGATVAETGASVPPDQIVSRRDIVRMMRNRLGIPIRKDGFDTQGGRIKGLYKVRGEGIRVASENDIETISHEVGHHLDKMLDLSDPKFDRELMAIGRITSGEGYTPNRIRNEGVAEFINWYVTDPKLAMQAAPQYFAEFDKRLRADKALWRTFKEAREMYAAWKALPPEQKIHSQISTSPAKPERNLGKLVDDLNTAIIDELDPLRRAVEDMTDGRALSIVDDPFQQAWLARGWAGKAETVLEHGLMDRNLNKIGPSFREIIEPVGKDLANFRSYATSRRIMELENKGINSGFDVADARKTLEKFGDNKLFQETFKKLEQYQDHLLEMLAEEGIYTRSDIARIKAANQEYLPFYRVFEEIEKQQLDRVSSKGFVDIKAPIKRMKGSDRDIIDPLESIIKDTYFFTNLAERNKVGRLLAELAESTDVHGASKWIDKVDPTKGKLDNLIFVWRDGEKHFYQLDPELYRAMKFLDQESTSILVKLLEPFAKMRRAGATSYDPRFWARNLFRDQIDAYIFSNYGFKPGIDLVSGMFSVLKRDDAYWKWKAAGGANATLSSLNRNYLQAQLRRMAGLSTKEKLKTILNPFEFMRNLSSVLEEATRVGEFKRGLKVEGATREGIMRSALSSRDVVLDFARKGSKTGPFNRLIPFFNAALQEPSKIIRAFRENPKRTTIRALTSITLPTIGLYMVNRNNPEYWKRAQWERDSFWLIPIDGGKDFLRFPKPFLMGQIFGTIPERVMNFMEKEDPSAFKDLHKSVLSAGWVGLIYAGLDTWFELKSNYSLFSEREIVPEGEQNLIPRLQRGPFTSETAKFLGDTFNVSPRKIDYGVRSLAAGGGELALKLSDRLLSALGVVDPPPAPTPRPQDKLILGTFYSQTGGSNSQYITDFYDGLNALRQEKNSARKVLGEVEYKLKTGQQIPQKDIDLIRRARAHEEALREQEAVAKELSELRKALNELHLSRDHTPEQKRALITQIEDRMNQLANRANQRRIQVVGR